VQLRKPSLPLLASYVTWNGPCLQIRGGDGETHQASLLGAGDRRAGVLMGGQDSGDGQVSRAAAATSAGPVHLRPQYAPLARDHADEPPACFCTLRAVRAPLRTWHRDVAELHVTKAS